MTDGRIRLLGAAFVLLAVGVAMILLVASMPRCVRGHHETRRMPMRTVTTPIYVGKVPVFTSHVIPAHDERCWVCDEWEHR